MLVRPSSLRLLVTVILAVSSRSAFASWPHSPGTNLFVCAAAHEQDTPTSVPDGAGGVIIVWRDYRNGVHQDIYAQHVLVTGVVDPAWPINGRALCTALGPQEKPAITSDGAGGAIVAWQDFRTGANYDIYAQHVLASGAVDGVWPADGRVLCAAVGNQQTPVIVSDGAGGAIVAWEDLRNGYDVYAQRVLANGSIPGAWPANGAAICTAADLQTKPKLVSDGANGAIITWEDRRASFFPTIYAQHLLSNGAADAAWTANGRALSGFLDQHDPTIAADGAGGALITWWDGRSGSDYDVYAQHVLASGALDIAWPVDGSVVSSTNGDQSVPTILSDGSGGALIAWNDSRSGTSNDVYAQHVFANGLVDPTWPVNGTALCTNTFNQVYPSIVSDGAGGAIVTWTDKRAGNDDVYAQHLQANGQATWTYDGVALCIASGDQSLQTTVADGRGGAIVAWQDTRTGPYDIVAQRVAPSGYLGNPEPSIAGVRDVPNDQGGEVKVSWLSSWLDTESPYVLDHFWIFRSVPPNVAQAAMRNGARLLRDGDDAPTPGERAYLALAQAPNYYWEYLGSTPAAHFTANYSYVAPTTGDSIGGANPKTAFLVVAYAYSNTLFFASSPDSGYSVDNLAPGAPAPFAGQYFAGVSHLHWGSNPDADVANYRLYRGLSAGFVPSTANRIASPTGTAFDDPSGTPFYYKLSAVDIHGNESAFAALLPDGVLDAPASTPPGELALERPSPNPSTGPVSLRYALPRDGSVSLAIFDATGRKVRQLVSDFQPAGAHALTWDRRDDAGNEVGVGLYFLRLEAGRTLVRQMAMIR